MTVLLNLRQVSADLGVHPSTIYRWMDENGFPRPRRLGPATVRWSADDVEAWKDSRANDGEAEAA